MNQETHPAPNKDTTISVREGVELRLLTAEYEEPMFELVQSNLDHLKPWVFWANDQFDRDENHKMFETNRSGYEAGTAYAMGVFVDGKLSGSVDIRAIGSEVGAEGGYWIDKDHLGQGLAPDCLDALINFAREHAGKPIDKILLHTMVENNASSQVAEKLGFVLEGLVENKEQHIQEKRYVKIYEPRQTS